MDPSNVTLVGDIGALDKVKRYFFVEKHAVRITATHKCHANSSLRIAIKYIDILDGGEGECAISLGESA